MNIKYKNISLILIILSVIFILLGYTFAYWTWSSTNNKQVSLVTSNELDKYIEYNPGTAKFIGDFNLVSNYYEGIYTTVSIKKKDIAANIDMYGTLYMDVNTIDSDLANYTGLKWVVTQGNNTSRTVVREGNFTGRENNSTMAIYSGIELSTFIQEFTIWLWLDNSISPDSDISKKKLDTNIWMYIDQVYSESYDTEGEYELIIPKTGTYLLETWGAQGGSYNSEYHGGYGGYSVGEINLPEGTTLYVNVGGAGINKENMYVERTYNGGGDANGYHASNKTRNASSGGGATHIATVSGELVTLSEYAGNDNSPILIVSGGGGGTHYANYSRGYGGSAGGTNGSSSNWENLVNYHTYYIYATGGKQDEPGTGGKSYSSPALTASLFGSSYIVNNPYNGANYSGGGGGYYGGGMCHWCPGAGGSSYIANINLFNKHMYCYDCGSDSNTTETSNISNTPISKYVKKGSGAARITFIG